MSTCRAGHRLGGPEVVLGIFAWMTLTFMEWILSGPPFGMIIGKQKLQVSRFNLFQPLKNDGGHKLSLPKKWCFQRKFVSVFFWYGVFCCYLFQTWVFKRGFFSVVTTLNPTKPRFFLGKPDFCCFSSMVFSSKRQAYATIGPRGSLLQKRFRLSGRRPWGSRCLGLKHQGKLQVP